MQTIEVHLLYDYNIIDLNCGEEGTSINRYEVSVLQADGQSS
jgi:hypothetical protein